MMRHQQDLISQDLEHQARTRRIMILIAFVLLAASLAMAYLQFTYVSSKINEADKYFSEYRNAKALEVLYAAKQKYRRKNAELDFMLIYAFVNSDRFVEAEKLASDLETIPSKYRKRFIKVMDIACYNDRTKLVTRLIDRAGKLELKPGFFIKTSKTRDDIDSELDVLEAGYKYMKARKHSSDADANLTKLENYLLKRYLEIGNIYLGNQQYKDALEFLKKAKELGVSKNSPLKSELHYSLGVAYRNTGNYNQAVENISESAQLGSGRARVMLSDINYEAADKVEPAKEEKEKGKFFGKRDKPAPKAEPAKGTVISTEQQKPQEPVPSASE